MSELFDEVDALLASRAVLPPPAERKRLRAAHGLTFDEVATALKVCRAAVSGWESGKTDPVRAGMVPPGCTWSVGGGDAPRAGGARPGCPRLLSEEAECSSCPCGGPDCTRALWARVQSVRGGGVVSVLRPLGSLSLTAVASGGVVGSVLTTVLTLPGATHHGAHHRPHHGVSEPLGVV